jgi:3-carboxy-cis,cis-muconate cycloisomerase
MPFLPLVDVFADEAVVGLFSEQALVAGWVELERALAQAQAELGVIPASAAYAIEREARPERVDVDALRERTRVVGYPILPLLEQVSATAEPDVARYVHWGATTQDAMDTALALLLRDVLDRIEELALRLGTALAATAEKHRETVMAGRTHAQPAVPITFGGKIAVLLAELARHVERLRAARTRAAVVQLFGAAGTAAALGARSRDVRRRFAELLSLGLVDVPWHTARDGVAEAGFVLGALAATCGKIAHEVIALSRPELGEVREAQGDHRGASSTMPQKANPIDSEAVVGLSLVAAAQVPVLLAAMQPGHERGAGEWQAEWDGLPLLAAAASGAVAGAARIVEGLQVFPARARANLDLDGGSIMAEAAMMAAAPMLGRSAAHDAVYRACAAAREESVPLATTLPRELDVTQLPPLEELLDPARYLGESDAIVTAAIAQWTTAAGTVRP